MQIDIFLTVNTVSQNLFRTSNLIDSCWPKALLFQSWGSLLVLFALGLSIVIYCFLNQSCEPFLELPAHPTTVCMIVDMFIKDMLGKIAILKTFNFIMYRVIGRQRNGNCMNIKILNNKNEQATLEMS